MYSMNFDKSSNYHCYYSCFQFGRGYNMCLQLLTDSANQTITNGTAGNCSVLFGDHIFVGVLVPTLEKPPVHKFGKDFFAYITPIILIVGLTGNALSLAVFTSHKMRNLSAGTYLASLAIADICALLFYVLPEWLRRGLVHINSDIDTSFIDKNGPCQISLYLSYVSRIMSTWTIVVFTVERFTGVCYPLKAFKRNSRSILLILLGISLVLSIYKPVLSGEYSIRGRTACGPTPKFRFQSFILDSVFALSITLVPFIIITALNILITRKLFLRNTRPNDLFAEDTKIRLEFTLILLAISFFFVAFNLPYFSVWARNFLKSRFVQFNDSDKPRDIEHWNGVLNVTRVIFYLNYCVNFFLYNITGAYFRTELARLLHIRRHRRRVYGSSIRCSRIGSSLSTTSTHMMSSSSCHATYIA